MPRRALREVAGARQRLRDRGRARAPLRAHPGARSARSARRTRASASDGVLLLSETDEPRLRRRAADLQPGRLGGRAVGQRRARGRALPAPQRLGGRGQLLGAHRGGRDPAAHHRPGHLHGRHGQGPAALGARLPERRRGRRRHDRGRRAGSSPSSSCRWATRSARSSSAEGSRSSTWRATAPPIERHELFPRRTNVSFWQRDRRARDPRAHLRARRGGDDVVGHRRHGRRRGRGAAAAWRAR